MAWSNKGPTPENLSQARGFFQRALALDPANVDALVFMAHVEAFTATYLLSDDKAERLAAAEIGLTKALSLAPEHARAHLNLGIVFGWTKRVEQGIAECERALAIDRNLANAHAAIGARKVYVGRAEETEAHVREALRLSPRDPEAFYSLMLVGTAKAFLGRHEEAVDFLRRSVEANPTNRSSHIFLAAALALFGRPEEARAAARAALAVNPQATIARFRATLASFSDNPVFSRVSSASPKACAWRECRRATRRPIEPTRPRLARQLRLRLASRASSLPNEEARFGTDSCLSWAIGGGLELELTRFGGHS